MKGFLGSEKDVNTMEVIPSMDNENKNLLDAMYADMKPFTGSSTDSNEPCEPGCEIR